MYPESLTDTAEANLPLRGQACLEFWRETHVATRSPRRDGSDPVLSFRKGPCSIVESQSFPDNRRWGIGLGFLPTEHLKSQNAGGKYEEMCTHWHLPTLKRITTTTHQSRATF